MILRNGRNGRGKEAAISSIALVVIIILATALFLFAAWYISSSSSNYCCGSIVKTINLQSASFNASTSTLVFVVNNPGQSANVTSVTVTGGTNHTSSCNGSFVMVTAGGPSTESCTVSGASFNKSETVDFVVYFSNGQGINSMVTAQ